MSKFDIDSVKPIKVKKGVRLFKDSSIEFFKNESAVQNVLAEALLEGDKDSFHEILCSYLNVINKEELSRRSNVPIATIRRMAAGSNFNINNLLKIFSALNKDKAA